MALTSERDKAVCAKYSTRDSEGFVHCNECPLNLEDRWDMPLACKATHHYDRHRKEWVLDDWEESTNDGRRNEGSHLHP